MYLSPILCLKQPSKTRLKAFAKLPNFLIFQKLQREIVSTNLDPNRCLRRPVSASVGVVGACAYDCDCGCVNVSGSVCDVCAWAWLCTVAVAVVAAAAAEDEDEDEACARCSRHGPLPLDRSSMISSSPSSTTHHPPAERSRRRC